MIPFGCVVSEIMLNTENASCLPIMMGDKLVAGVLALFAANYVYGVVSH